MKGPVQYGFELVTIFVLSCGAMLGQAVSQISGTTRDASGAVVPGVEVTAIQTGTGVKRTTVTSAAGDFVLPNLQIGPYRLEASKPGFQTYIQDGIELRVNTSPVIPITLGVGEVSQSVEVQANASLVETQNLGVGTVMETQRILDLPLNGRTPTDLIPLTGAAVQTGISPTYSMNTGVTISVAGGVDFGVYYALDGAPHLNLYDSTNMPLPFPDALQEFKVDTSTQNAQTGIHSGAQVNSVTRSGTNSFHGDAFEFLRNGAVNARNFFATTPDNLKRNQFGGVVGGPILKNKLFFFGGYQGTTTRQSPAPTTTFVPTAAMLQGDFSAFASASCQGTNRTLAAPFTTLNGKPNQIPQSLISPVALKLATYLPPAVNDCGLYRSYAPVSQYYWQVPVRFDFQLNAQQSFFFRYLATKQNQLPAHDLTPDNVINVGNNGTNDLATSITAGHSWVASASIVNSIRLSMNRISLDHYEDQYFDANDLGINAFTYVPKAMWLTITGGPGIGNGTGLNKRSYYTYVSGNDDFSLVHGSHQFSFGANLMHGLVTSLANAFSAGFYTFNGQTTGLGWADVFAGKLSQIRQAIPNDLRMYQWFLGAYGQDTWKITSRLTMNSGLRWEPFLPMQIKNDEVYSFSLDRFYAGDVSSVWTNAPPGFTYPGDRGFHGRSGIEGSWRNFQPRVGLAYDPFGDGKTSIRIGAGIAFDFMNEESYQNLVTAPPFGGSTILPGPLPLADPWSTNPGGNPFPYVSSPPLGKFPAGSAYVPVPPNFKTTQVYNWNFGIQRQFTSALFASATYLGSHGIHLPTLFELNPGVLLNVPSVPSTDPRCKANSLAVNCTANLTARRALNLANPTIARLGNVTSYDDGPTSHYNGLLLNLTWRATDHVSINTNYTWSHCIGVATNGNLVPNPGQNYLHQENRALEAGDCVQDRRQVFNLTVVASTPQFSQRALNLVASGWSLSTIYRAQSGAPMTILSGLDQALNGFNTSERPNQVLPDTSAANQGGPCAKTAPCVQWLNPAAFAQPALGTYGNIGVGNVAGPGFFQFDAALARQFRIRENQSLQLRFEAFNVTNSLRLSRPIAASPSLTVSNPALFGTITTALDPRILQFAMKFVF
jgi:Carboxypeptidase regulatory-like domain